MSHYTSNYPDFEANRMGAQERAIRLLMKKCDPTPGGCGSPGLGTPSSPRLSNVDDADRRQARGARSAS